MTTRPRYMVMADRNRTFDDLDVALDFARANYPSVVCEWKTQPDGLTLYEEIFRHDYLFDEVAKEWRILLMRTG
jgi:hypothetical protein